MKNLFSEHVQTRQKAAEYALSQSGYAGLILSSGRPHVYFADDQEAIFHPTPHFGHWCPERSPYHLLKIEAGKKPKLVFYSPDDFWHAQPEIGEWSNEFDVVMVKSLDKRWIGLGEIKNFAFIGPEEPEAQTLKLNPRELITRLDWGRALKTAYEVQCIQKSNALAALGHKRVKQVFLASQATCSELELHHEFLRACSVREMDLAYQTIIGVNEKSAILHYHDKRQNIAKPQTLLIDAGTNYLSYASDITRTYAHEQAAQEFKDLLKGMDDLQQQLCAEVKAQVEFRTLHKSCHNKIARLLIDSGILKDCDEVSAVKKGLSQVFLPHGLGHMLGLQVHDVAGDQINELGDKAWPDEDFPNLRTQRALRAQEVVTIEPGLYFIDMKLRNHRHGDLSRHFNWPLIDKLLPLGGIRIEDNVLVLNDGMRNLTREVL